MERVLTSDERLRRAEEMYYRRKGVSVNKNDKPVKTPMSNKKYLVKKMVIQIVICLVVYCSYYVVKNCNFIFSQDFMSKTNQILSYDINIQEIYCKVANYINNYSYFNKKEDNSENTEEEIPQEDTNNEDTAQENANESVGANEEDILAVAKVDDEEETTQEDNSLSQMELDAKEIKENYSLINPLVGQITSRFGAREQTEKIVSPYHVGLDIAANTGTSIVASMEGTVVLSEELGGYGNCVQIKKDDVLTLYGHCSKLYVNKGDTVLQGQKIAEVGATRKCNWTAFTF